MGSHFSNSNTGKGKPPIPNTLEKQVSKDIEERKAHPATVIAAAPVSFDHVATQLGEPLDDASSGTLLSYYQALVDWGATEDGQLCSDSLKYIRDYGDLRKWKSTHEASLPPNQYNHDLVIKMNDLWKEYIWKGTYDPKKGYQNEHVINISDPLSKAFNDAIEVEWMDKGKISLDLFDVAQRELIALINDPHSRIWKKWHESTKRSEWLQTADGQTWAEAHPIPDVSAHSDYQDLLFIPPSAHRQYANYYEPLSDYAPQQLSYHGSSYNEHNEVNTLSLIVLLIIICIVCIVKDILLCTGCFVFGRAWPLTRKNVDDDHNELV
eukprot:45769_1